MGFIFGRNDANGQYTPMEILLANVIGKVLKLDEIGIYDNFTDIGVNSIVVVKIQDELESLDINISLADMYRSKNISELACSIAKEEDTSPERVADSNQIEQYEKGIPDLVPFRDVFYKSCFYIAVFAVVRWLNKDIKKFLVHDVFAYEENVDDPVFHVELKNHTRKSIYEILSQEEIHFIAKLHECQTDKEFTVQADDRKLLMELREFIGIRQNKTAEPAEHLIPQIKEALEQKNPVIILVDTYYLSYRKDSYKKEHWFHSLLLVGYQKEEKVFYAVEHLNRDSLQFEIRKISMDETKRAYQGFLANYNDCAKVNTYYQFTDEVLPGDKSGLIEEPELLGKLYDETVAYWQSTLNRSGEYLELLRISLAQTIKDKVAMEKYSNQMLLLLNQFINARKVEQYIRKSVVQSDDELMDMLGEILNLWGRIRTRIIKYEFAHKYNKTKMNELCMETELVIRKEKEYFEKISKKLKEN